MTTAASSDDNKKIFIGNLGYNNDMTTEKVAEMLKSVDLIASRINLCLNR